MNFYQAMQLGANNLKPLIKNTTDKSLKKKYIAALINKDILCILFCILIITVFSKFFGSENSIVGVVTVISILTYRLSNLGFDAKQSAITMLVIFGIFIVGPYFATTVHPIIGFIINFISIMAIVVLSCYNTILSNQSILVLSYILLYGYEVSNQVVYSNRIIGLSISGIIVSTIMYLKNRKRDFKVTIKDVIESIDLRSDRTKWQLKLSLGVCLGILIGELMHMPKSMWIGFSCLSLLQPDKSKLDDRCKERPIYTIIGCIIFATVYLILPESIKSNIGMIGGLMLGLSATYRWQTVFNSFGALISAIPMLGLGWAIILRITYAIFSSFYIKGFNALFIKIDENLSSRNLVDKIVE